MAACFNIQTTPKVPALWHHGEFVDKKIIVYGRRLFFIGFFYYPWRRQDTTKEKFKEDMQGRLGLFLKQIGRHKGAARHVVLNEWLN